jgi:hypothetical protein
MQRGTPMGPEEGRREASQRRGQSGRGEVSSRVQSRPQMISRAGAGIHETDDDKPSLPRPGLRFAATPMRATMVISRAKVAATVNSPDMDTSERNIAETSLAHRKVE